MEYFNGTRMRWIPDPPYGSIIKNLGVIENTLIVDLPSLLPIVNQLS